MTNGSSPDAQIARLDERLTGIEKNLERLLDTVSQVLRGQSSIDVLAKRIDHHDQTLEDIRGRLRGLEQNESANRYTFGKIAGIFAVASTVFGIVSSAVATLIVSLLK